MAVSMDRWVGKVAIVTGASSGIGKSTAEKLVEQGLKVAVLDRRYDRLEELERQLTGKKGKLYPIKADLTKEKDILSAFKWIKENVGLVHILINNAGMRQPTTLHDGNTEIWQRIFKVNVLALCIATREAIRDMKENNVDGHIVNINSVLGHKVGPGPNKSVYPASKHAVTALTETLRLELVALKSRIKVTSISPGTTLTEFDDSIAKKKGMLGLEPEDVADAILYVLSTPPHVQVHELTIKPVGEEF